MKMTTRRLFGFLLSLVLAFGLLPGMTALAVGITVGDNYQIGSVIDFGNGTLIAPADWFTGQLTLGYGRYMSDSNSHRFKIISSTEDRYIYLPDTDSTQPWGITVTGGTGTRDNPFELAVQRLKQYELWIGDTQVTNIKSSGKGWKYNHENHTLTLENYINDGTIHSQSCIFYNDENPLTIELKGKNIINIETQSYGIYSEKANLSLNFTGNGSLEINNKVEGTASSGHSIRSAGNISIKNCTITTKGGYIGINSNGIVQLLEGCCVIAGGTDRGILATTSIDIEPNVKSVVAYGDRRALDELTAFLQNDIPGIGSVSKEGQEETGHIIKAGKHEISTLKDGDQQFKRVEFPKSTYEITKTQDVEHVIGSNTNAVITISNLGDDSVTFKRFTHEVFMDGKKIREADDFNAKAGSLILTLKSEYLDKLTVGDHKVMIKFTDGSVDTNIKIKAVPTPTPTSASTPDPTATPKPVPKTGDHANPALWLGMILVGLLGIGGIAFTVRKRG